MAAAGSKRVLLNEFKDLEKQQWLKIDVSEGQRGGITRGCASYGRLADDMN